jgi:arylsulfatase A-like enzyme
MNRNGTLLGMLVVGWLVAAAIGTAWAAEAPARKPNIVILVADDLGYADVGFHGGKEIPTPHLDALAAAGTRFSNGYATCPVCSPSRAGLVTGRYQQRFGHEFNPGGGGSRPDFGVPLEEQTIADALRAVGYKTGLVGKWHLGAAPELRPLRRGFDEFYGFLGGAHPYQLPNSIPNAVPIFSGENEVDEKEYLTDAIGREAVAYINRHAEQPFLLLVTFNGVHTPLEAPAKYLERFPDIADRRHKTYAAMLSAVDENIGRVLAALHEKNLDRDTLVFFISDNGGPPQANTSSNRPLSGAKGSVLEGGIRVPFVLRWTGCVPAGAVYEQPVISLDITATAAAVAGAALGGGKPIDGVNLVPFVTGQDQGTPHKQLAWRFGPQWAIRQGNYKLLKTADSQPRLYDLAADIGEQNDLAADKPELVSQLEQDYASWSSELVEPRWQPVGRGRKKQQQRRAQAAAVN